MQKGFLTIPSNCKNFQICTIHCNENKILKIKNKKMKQKIIVDFINSATAAEIDKLGEDTDNSIGLETSMKIIEYRNQLESKAFTTIEELKNVKGFGDVKLAKLLRAAETLPEPEFIKSNTILHFRGEPQIIEHLKDDYYLKKIESFQKESEENIPILGYELYYNQAKISKDILLQSFQTKGGFVAANPNYFSLCAFQAYDQTFLSVNDSDEVTFSNVLTDNEIFKFRNDGTTMPNWPHRRRYPQVNYDIYHLGTHGFKLDKFGGDGIYYDYPNARLMHDKNGVLANGSPSNNPFDFEAFYLPNSIKFMNFFSDDNFVSTNDPRRFIAKEGQEAKGSNTTGWFPRNHYRIVSVFKNISIKNKVFSTNTHNALITVDGHGKVYSNRQLVNSYIPDNSVFDMFVFNRLQSGRWLNYNEYTPKVVFKSKSMNRYLTVDDNGYIHCAASEISHNQYFALEQMWGDDITDAAIKTHQDKYLQTYNGEVLPYGINKIDFEAYKILVP